LLKSLFEKKIKNGKDMAPNPNLPRTCRPPKLMKHARRAIIREAKKRPKLMLKAMHSRSQPNQSTS